MSSKVQRIMVQPIVSEPTLQEHPTKYIGGHCCFTMQAQQTHYDGVLETNIGSILEVLMEKEKLAPALNTSDLAYYNLESLAGRIFGNQQRAPRIFKPILDRHFLENLIFRYLQQRSTVQIWLYEQLETRIEGQIIGFDEFMNLVLDGAFEVDVKKGTRKEIGRILLKGDNITLIQSVSAPES
ncbi:hypothetical protein BGZ96_006000 [Linnemannia gamsii]|uniref:Small nuclear ribonucleoprotein E n=1 Tax=Linnemannia gamsii TaxID=64522 RepID=A0ABQ7K3X7_9FUNG|nr:hypothetical protein BGZ96_006000 [Linnemannia gamsii]